MEAYLSWQIHLDLLGSCCNCILRGHVGSAGDVWQVQCSLHDCWALLPAVMWALQWPVPRHHLLTSSCCACCACCAFKPSSLFTSGVRRNLKGLQSPPCCHVCWPAGASSVHSQHLGYCVLPTAVAQMTCNRCHAIPLHHLCYDLDYHRPAEALWVWLSSALCKHS